MGLGVTAGRGTSPERGSPSIVLNLAFDILYSMIDVFWYFTSLLVFIGAVYALFSWNKHVLSKKIIAESNELDEKFKKYQARLNKMSSYPQENVKESIGTMGVDGIIDSLGLPSILKPVAKGLVDSYLNNPEKLKGLLDKLGVKLPNVKQTTNETGLL
jgi:hypothetical protein